MVEVSKPYWLAPTWNTLTDIVEMKIGKFRPKVPIRNSISSTTLRSGRPAT